MSQQSKGCYGTDQIDDALFHLGEYGHVVLENVLSQEEVIRIRDNVDDVAAQERQTPFEPGDGPAMSQDRALEEFLSDSYTVDRTELQRLLKRIRFTRAQSAGTPWPVKASEVSKLFLHLPTMFDHGKSQRVWNLLNKGVEFEGLVENPSVLHLVHNILDEDCVLSDCSATSIGSQTGGGAWHVDVPLGQIQEPLPDFPLTTQNVFMLDDFTTENGATRVVPGSHLTRKKPKWSKDKIEGEVILSAPAGSVAMWLSNTWHRSGPNFTDSPRRAILCYYCRSWVKPFNDFRASLVPDIVAGISPRLRYLLGFSSSPPVRG